MTRYVQSKWNKDAPVWEVDGETSISWRIMANARDLLIYDFAKSEYVEVPAPEKWEEVSVRVVEANAKSTLDPGGVYHGAVKIAELLCKGKYRIKTLIVERKVRP